MSTSQVPCACPLGSCDANFDMDGHEHCIYRLSGIVQIDFCAICGPGASWHRDGSCLRCKAIAEGRLKPFVPPASKLDALTAAVDEAGVYDAFEETQEEAATRRRRQHNPPGPVLPVLAAGGTLPSEAEILRTWREVDSTP